MSSFWGVEVKPGKPYTLTDGDSLGRLRLTQATLGEAVGKGEKGAGGKKCVLQCSVNDKDPLYLCALIPEQSETCHLELEFDEEQITFSVIGSRSIHLAGYHIPDEYDNDMSDSDVGSDSLEGSDDDGHLESDDDGNMVMLDHMATDSEDDGSDYDSESDEDMAYNQPRSKSSVVIEEIQEDDKPASGVVQKGCIKKHINENGDKSQLQLAVRTPAAEPMESEDEDGFPVSLSESKKSSESVSKNTKETSNEGRKRKSEADSNRGDSSGEVKAENDGTSKKKKKAKNKGTVVGNGKVNDEEKDVKQQESPANPVDAKQKKMKKITNSSEVATDQQSAEKKQIQKDDKEVAAQEASKKSNKQKMQEASKSGNQAHTGITESAIKKGPLQTRTFGNGLIIEELEMGKPNGKRATGGKKVSVRYIGKLKNGKIFDSNVSGRPFEFRLGVGEVIKGWDVGVDGMRIGDKRRLTVPPSMGYGNKKAGPIPPNSTLYFDVELVNVR